NYTAMSYNTATRNSNLSPKNFINCILLKNVNTSEELSQYRSKATLHLDVILLSDSKPGKSDIHSVNNCQINSRNSSCLQITV
ncbi:15405_t:CDS:1, partial [Funneliformis geosporum]